MDLCQLIPGEARTLYWFFFELPEIAAAGEQLASVVAFFDPATGLPPPTAALTIGTGTIVAGTNPQNNAAYQASGVAALVTAILPCLVTVYCKATTTLAGNSTGHILIARMQIQIAN